MPSFPTFIIIIVDRFAEIVGLFILLCQLLAIFWLGWVIDRYCSSSREKRKEEAEQEEAKQGLHLVHLDIDGG